jgi:hypothetical protein
VELEMEIDGQSLLVNFPFSSVHCFVSESQVLILVASLEQSDAPVSV